MLNEIRHAQSYILLLHVTACKYTFIMKKHKSSPRVTYLQPGMQASFLFSLQWHLIDETLSEICSRGKEKKRRNSSNVSIFCSCFSQMLKRSRFVMEWLYQSLERLWSGLIFKTPFLPGERGKNGRGVKSALKSLRLKQVKRWQEAWILVINWFCSKYR